MDILAPLSNQYLASLKMLEKSISVCPEPLWLDEGYPNPFWHVAYHTLFYTHLYLSPDEASFSPGRITAKGTTGLSRPLGKSLNPIPARKSWIICRFASKQCG